MHAVCSRHAPNFADIVFFGLFFPLGVAHQCYHGFIKAVQEGNIQWESRTYPYPGTPITQRFSHSKYLPGKAPIAPFQLRFATGTCKRGVYAASLGIEQHREPSNEGFMLRCLGSSSVGNLQTRGLRCVAWDQAASGTYKQGVYAASLGIEHYCASPSLRQFWPIGAKRGSAKPSALH